MNYYLLVEKRLAKSYTLEEVANFLGVSKQAYFKWEKGKTKPTTENLIKLSKVLDVSIDDLASDPVQYKYSESRIIDKDKHKNHITSVVASLIFFPLILGLVIFFMGYKLAEISFVSETDKAFNQTVGYMNYMNVDYQEFLDLWGIEGIGYYSSDTNELCKYDSKGIPTYVSNYKFSSWGVAHVGPPDEPIEFNNYNHTFIDEHMIFYISDYKEDGAPLGMGEIWRVIKERNSK